MMQIVSPLNTMIGQRYSVPCVRTRIDRLGLRWVPIMGPAHRDVEHIGLPNLHWHHDYRFFSPAVYRHMCRNRDNPFGAVEYACEKEHSTEQGGSGCDESEYREVTYRKLICYRVTPVFPLTYKLIAERSRADGDVKHFRENGTMPLASAKQT